MADFVTPERRTTTGGVGQVQAGGAQALLAGVSDAAGVLSQVEDQRGQIYADKALAQAKLDWTQRSIDARNGMAEDGAGYAAAMEKDFDAYSRDVLAKAPGSARERLAAGLDQYRVNIAGRALEDEAAQRAVWQSDQVTESAQLRQNALILDPSQFEDALADQLESIDGLDLPPDVKGEMEDKARAAFAATAMGAMVQADPSGALAAIKSGAWDGYLQPSDKARYLAEAEAKDKVARTDAIAQSVVAAGRDARKQRDDALATPVGRAVYNGLIARGLAPHVAAAILVNGVDESGLNPNINEANPTVAGSRGGYGLMQWTGARRKALEEAARVKGVPPSDLELQLDFLAQELRTTEKAAGDALSASTSEAEAADIVLRQFLRPAQEHQDRRGAKYAGLSQDKALQAAIAGLPMDEQLAVARQAAQYNALYAGDVAAYQSRLEVEQATRVADLDLRMSRGQASYADVENAYIAGDLSPAARTDRLQQLDRARIQRETETQIIEDTRRRVAAGQELNPLSERDQKGVDLVFGEATRDASPEEQQALGVAYAAEVGVLPTVTAQSLRIGMERGDATAYQAASELQQSRPELVAADKALSARLADYTAFTAAGLSAEEALLRTRQLDQMTDAERKTVDARMAEEMKDLLPDGAAGIFAEGWFSSPPTIGAAEEAGIASEFATSYRANRLRGMTATEAEERAKADIRTRWAPSAAAGGAVMRNAPELHFVASVVEKIPAQLAADLPGMTGVRLRSDRETEADIRAGVAPSYVVEYTDANGLVQVDLGRRWTPEQQAPQEAERAAALSATRAQQAQDDRQWFTTRGLRVPRGARTSAGRADLRYSIETWERQTGQTYQPGTDIPILKAPWRE